MEKFSNYLNYIAATIIAIVVIGVLIISFKFVGKEKPPVKTIKIEYHGVKTDSINELNKIEIEKISILLDSIKSTSNKIQQKQIQLIEEKERDDFFNKLYTAFIAIILAIAGFFGFKSVSEIKQRAITDAKEQARYIADKEFDNIFDKKYRATVVEESTQALSQILKSEVGSLEDRLSKLEEDYSKTTGTESYEPKASDNSEEEIDETNNNQPENIFDDEQDN
jgi:methyl-accepting chemotaxis protein